MMNKNWSYKFVLNFEKYSVYSALFDYFVNSILFDYVVKSVGFDDFSYSRFHYF